MGKELAAQVFDYSTLDKAVKGKLIALAGQVKREKAKHATSGMAIGESISEAHDLLAGDGRDGTFANWVELECGFGRTTAYNYMWTWRRFGKCSSLEHFTQEALYALASPKTPETAVNEAVKLADKGVYVNKERADEILGKFRDLSNSVAAGRDARKPEGTPATPKGGSNPPATASGKDERTESTGKKPQEPSPRPSGSDTDKPGDFGTCPNCGGKKWTEDEFGATCAKCNQPHGEPVGDQDEGRAGTQRSKSVKTVEALMRAISDLHRLLPKPKEHAHLIAQCKMILTELRAWK